jgi:hypothetical protein
MRPHPLMLLALVTLGAPAVAFADPLDAAGAPPAFLQLADAAPPEAAVPWSTPSLDGLHLTGDDGQPLLAQYFDGRGTPTDGAGYFPDTPRSPLDGPLLARQYGNGFVAAFHLGVGLSATTMSALDDSFHTPNEAENIGLTLPMTFEAGAYLEFGGFARVGLQGGGMFAVSRDASVSGSQFGGVVEFGGGDAWRFWGGIGVGGRWLASNARDIDGRDYGWRSNSVQYRLHGHVERQLNPWVSLRLTPWVALGTLFDEEFTVPQPTNAPSNVIPRDSGFGAVAGGLLFSVVLGTGR